MSTIQVVYLDRMDRQYIVEFDLLTKRAKLFESGFVVALTDRLGLKKLGLRPLFERGVSC